MFNEKMLNALMKNKKLNKLVSQMGEVAAQLMGFAQTYMGIYDDKGNQIEKGDRDYLFETLDRIEKKLAEIEDKLKTVEDRLSQR